MCQSLACWDRRGDESYPRISNDKSTRTLNDDLLDNSPSSDLYRAYTCGFGYPLVHQPSLRAELAATPSFSALLAAYMDTVKTGFRGVDASQLTIIPLLFLLLTSFSYSSRAAFSAAAFWIGLRSDMLQELVNVPHACPSRFLRETQLRRPRLMYPPWGP